MMTYELDDIEKEVLLGKVVERARADLNDGRPLTEMRQRPAEIDFTTELSKHGYRTVPDGSAVIVISGDGRGSRARRYESAQVAYNTLILYPAMEAKQRG